MTQSTISVGKAYYTAMGNKDLAAMGACLHSEVRFKSPLAERVGRENVLQAAKGLLAILKSLRIRAAFGDGDQVMLVLDLDFEEEGGVFPSAALLTVQEERITSIELFFDARAFEVGGAFFSPDRKMLPSGGERA